MTSSIIITLMASSQLKLSCSTGAGTSAAPKRTGWWEAGAWLVGVRTSQEFATGHIAGAVNIPVQELERRMGELTGKHRPIVLYCRSGARSSSAARMLESAGYTEIHDLGSMSRW